MSKRYNVVLEREHPQYMPQEGGYYATCTEIIHRKCKTRKQAQAWLAEIAEVESLEIENPNFAAQRSEYVGRSIYAYVLKNERPPQSVPYHIYE